MNITRFNHIKQENQSTQLMIKRQLRYGAEKKG